MAFAELTAHVQHGAAGRRPIGRQRARRGEHRGLRQPTGDPHDNQPREHLRPVVGSVLDSDQPPGSGDGHRDRADHHRQGTSEASLDRAGGDREADAVTGAGVRQTPALTAEKCQTSCIKRALPSRKMAKPQKNSSSPTVAAPNIRLPKSSFSTIGCSAWNVRHPRRGRSEDEQADGLGVAPFPGRALHGGQDDGGDGDQQRDRRGDVEQPGAGTLAHLGDDPPADDDGEDPDRDVDHEDPPPGCADEQPATRVACLWRLTVEVDGGRLAGHASHRRSTSAWWERFWSRRQPAMATIGRGAVEVSDALSRRRRRSGPGTRPAAPRGSTGV
jgi:hypothetical protein